MQCSCHGVPSFVLYRNYNGQVVTLSARFKVVPDGYILRDSQLFAVCMSSFPDFGDNCSFSRSPVHLHNVVVIYSLITMSRMLASRILCLTLSTCRFRPFPVIVVIIWFRSHEFVSYIHTMTREGNLVTWESNNTPCTCITEHHKPFWTGQTIPRI